MRKYLVGILAGAVLATGAGAATHVSWQDRYSPSRLEWLEMTLNARDKIECNTRGQSYCVGFEYQAQAPGGILIIILTHGDVPQHVYDSAVSQAKSNVDVRAKLMGQHVDSSVRRIDAPLAAP